MSDVYNNKISKHYAAYRPPVHKAILESIFPTEPFKHGLDIGCGTGVSTIALVPFCAQTTSVDPSQLMLEQAQPTANI
ncbi:methyltransferase domain-containing protein [Vibrio mexicanus]|uniref:methyltransferase domain-containing protein n=1 Tax=Vibrio mexicanus TaxID=1004326 RepID=UPI00063C4943|nr:methyltransferase domain-containing protein [Vibrio mexicanus]